MALPHGVRRLFRLPPSTASYDRETEDEIAFHLATGREALEAAGWDSDAARREAERRFGDAGSVRAECGVIDGQRVRRQRRSELVRELLHDLRLALRQVVRSPGLAVTAVATLALGIGATTAIFSLVHAVLLRPLPFPEPERVVLAWEGPYERRGDVSAGNFAEWREGADAFSALAAVQVKSFNLATRERPERLIGVRATGDYFRVFGVAPELGRVFGEAEDRPGAPPVAVLSDATWRRRFGGDPDIVGREVEIDGRPHTILGVMPEGFDPTIDQAQLWVPMAFGAERLATYDEHTYLVAGRLRPGASRALAQEQLRAVAARHQQAAPEDQRNLDPVVTDLRADLVVGVRDRLLVLLAAVALVLLIACGNVANLLLARGSARRREMAVRTALGARRGRLVRQLLTESLALALLGGGAGVALALLLVRLLVTLAPAGVPRLEQAGIDGAVVLVALGLALVSSLLAGLAPALRQSGSRPQTALREGGRGTGGGRRDRLRGALVTAEIALALVLLVGAGLLIRSGIEAARVDPGFQVAQLLTARVTLPAAGYGDPARTQAAFRAMADRAAALPGVVSAAIANQLPLAGTASGNGLLLEGRPFEPDEIVEARLRLVSPEYFDTLRLPLVAGRLLTPADRAGALRVMLLNRTLAQRMFPDGGALGKRIACCEGSPDDPRWKTVVGIVGDERSNGLAAEAPLQFYIPLAQAPDASWDWLQRTMILAVRTEGDPTPLVEPLRRAVSAVDPAVPIYDVATMRERLVRSSAQARFNTLLLTLLGGAGLLLAAIGIFGTLAYLVEQRRHEIGVRMALGATAGQVAALVVRQALPTLAMGLVLGGAAALAAGRLIGSLLYGVRAGDPPTFAAVVALLVAVALAASFVPARRAARIDPARTLVEA